MPDLLVIAAENPVEHVIDKPIPALTFGPNFAITMHVVNLLVAGGLLIVTMLAAARAIGTGPASLGNERFVTKGCFAQFVEVIVEYLLNSVIKPQLGEKANRFAPLLLSLFFFILYNNLLGLIPLLDLQHLLGIHDPWLGGTATGNIAVTAALALITFVVIQVNGVRSLGLSNYLKHYMGGAPPMLAVIMVPVEIMGTFIKPFALAVRLFANMTAGHILLATLLMFVSLGLKNLGVIVGGGITIASVIASVPIMFLELFVAFLQAFIFTFLSTLFIAQLSHHHGDEHDEEHGHGHGHAAGAH
jgi:F-type H+-transporting ATPase subunit a